MSSGEQDARTAEIELPNGARAVERRERARLRVPVLSVLYHPDVSRVGERSWLSSLLSSGQVHLSRLAPAFSPPAGGERRPLRDPYLSRTPLVLAPGSSTGAVRLSTADSGTRVTADGLLIEQEIELAAEALERGVVLELARRVVLLLHTLAPVPSNEPPRFNLVGDSEVILQLRRDIQRVADLEVPVLLRGETGTGKELAARAIHRASPRRERPCLTVNLGAVPPALAAAELFGAVKGAFTGAVKSRAGYFRRADGGTLFLDEVGDAPPEVQVMLLRVLESGEIQQVGAVEPQRVDVRVIAATDTDLERAVAEERFKAPLLHRLAAYEIYVPPLRDRRDDIGRLLVHFLREELAALGEERRLAPPEDPAASPWLPASIVTRLARYDWPGNVRQVRNVARHLAIESRGLDHVRVSPQVDLVLREAEKTPRETLVAEEEAPAPRRQRYRKPSDVGEEELVGALRANRWRLKPTAEALGISRGSLYDLIARSSGVRKAADLSREEIESCHRRLAGDLSAMVEELEVSESGLKMRMRDLGIG